ncbi:hypothetical protein ABZS76_24835 [Streptomyces sp. NPDC005562]|uniref:hypothetical protein n=1 Tax=unclassified Streptomyces TaxID=2593676 RepID=UPI0033B5E9E1
MPTILVDQFKNVVRAWAVEETKRIARMQILRGGWEVWVQCELAAFLLAQESTLEVQRESYVYGGKKRADLLLNGNHPTASQRIIVEIKVMRASEYERAQFVEDILDDVAKLRDGLKAVHKGAQLIVLGLYFDANAPIPPGFTTEEVTHDVGLCWREMAVID